MKKLIAAIALTGALGAQAQTLKSPDGRSSVEVGVDAAGRPTWSYDFHGRKLILPSGLGFERDDREGNRENANLTDGFVIEAVETGSFDETWRPVWGEEAEIRDRHEELLVKLLQPKQNRRMHLRFRLFDDGVGFRYEFPDQRTLTYFTVVDELTEFRLAKDATAWWIPGDYDTQEFEYTVSKVSEMTAENMAASAAASVGNVSRTRAKAAVQTALMLKTDDGIYLNLHEAACIDYATMHLDVDAKALKFKSHLTPDRLGFRGRLQTACTTPWRTVIAGEKATDILASRLTLNLNEPCKIADTSWIKPMKYMGVWWSLICGVGWWSYADGSALNSVHLGVTDYSKLPPNGHHMPNTETTKRYLDFAGKYGFDGLLVEGWNVGWEDWFGNEKDYVFDFVTPYPDFDVDEVQRYAASKNVKMIMHHETSSSIRNYERHLEKAYQFMNDHGYPAVKSGYVGNIVPQSEHHYTQWMNNHYLYCITEAAKHRICVNAHEATRPTGICRTWPNWVGNESARGTEYQWFAGMRPGHTAILPFTRLIGGPMDYTPGIFEFDRAKVRPEGGPGAEGIIPSTICGQLALYVTMPSPLQMACDTPEVYSKFLDAFQFIVDVPVDWEKSVYLEGEPMEYLTAVRKAKGRDEWYLGGVTDVKEHRFTAKLGFLTPGVTYLARIYQDGPKASYKANNQDYVITERKVTSADAINLRAAPGGGYAVSFKPVK